MGVKSVNDIVKAHFINPKNIGRIKKPTNTNKYKSGFCGDTVEVYAIVENNIVQEIKYNVFGCHAVIAASSVISEWAKDKSIDELRNLKYETVISMLGGEIEEEKINCVKTAITAFANI